VAENIAGSFLIVMAIDPDSASLTYSLEAVRDLRQEGYGLAEHEAGEGDGSDGPGP
jgi:hypothetical protein